MILYPAIDLKDGVCVRLVRGEMSRATIFNTDPAQQARDFAASGFEWLHLIDLNGALEGRPVNAEAVAAVIEAVDIPVQLGGGIRNLETVETWLDAGCARVILGTAALADPDLVFMGQVLVIPGVGAVSPAPSSIVVVEWGDSLSVIAEDYGVTVAELLALNGLTDPDSLFVGQELLVPGGIGQVAKLGPTVVAVFLRIRK